QKLLECRWLHGAVPPDASPPLTITFAKLHSKSASSPRAYLAVDHQPTRSLKGYYRRVRARAEVSVDWPRGEPLLLQRALDLAHSRPGHVRVGQPVDDDLRFFDLFARITL